MTWMRGLLVVLALATCLASTPARAQVQVTPGYKGVVGLGIVGAELGFMIPAAAGLDELWSFLVFPVVGAAGGAVGGYFLLESTGQVEFSVAALAFGMAMIVPTMVLTLSATAYDPEDDEGEGTVTVPHSVEIETQRRGEPERPPAAIPEPSASRGLLRWSPGSLVLAVPGLTVTALYSPAELSLYGERQGTEVQVPLVSGRF